MWAQTNFGNGSTEQPRGSFPLEQANPPAFAVHLRLNKKLKRALTEATRTQHAVALRLSSVNGKAIMTVNGLEYAFSTAPVGDTEVLHLPERSKAGNESSAAAGLMGIVHQKLIIMDTQQQLQASAVATAASLKSHTATATHQAVATEVMPHITPSAASAKSIARSLPTPSSAKGLSSVNLNLTSQTPRPQAHEAPCEAPPIKQRLTPPPAQKTPDVAQAMQQQQQQQQQQEIASASAPSRLAPAKAASAVLDSRTARWAAMKGDLKLVVVAMLHEKPMPDLALNKAITTLYVEVNARPEAKEYIKRVVSEACELSMNRWRVREEVMFRELPRLLALNAQYAPQPEKPPTGKDKTNPDKSKKLLSQEKRQAEQTIQPKSLLAQQQQQQQGKKHKQQKQPEDPPVGKNASTLGTDETDEGGAKKRRKIDGTASPQGLPPVGSQEVHEAAATTAPVHRKVLEKRAASASYSLSVQGAGGGQPNPSPSVPASLLGQQPTSTLATAVQSEGRQLEDDEEDHPMIISRSSQGANRNSRRNGGLERQEKHTSPALGLMPGVINDLHAPAVLNHIYIQKQSHHAPQAPQQQHQQEEEDEEALPSLWSAQERGSSGVAPWVENSNSPSPPSQQLPDPHQQRHQQQTSQSGNDRRLAVQLTNVAREHPVAGDDAHRKGSGEQQKCEQSLSGDRAFAHRHSVDGRKESANDLEPGLNVVAQTSNTAVAAPNRMPEFIMPALEPATRKIKFDEDPEASSYQEWTGQWVHTVSNISSPENYAAAQVRHQSLQALHFGLRQKLTAAVAEVEAWHTSFHSSSCAEEQQTRAAQMWEIGARKWPMMQKWSRAADNLELELQAMQSDVLMASQHTQRGTLSDTQ